jgi:hypothetical protein
VAGAASHLRNASYVPTPAPAPAGNRRTRRRPAPLALPRPAAPTSPAAARALFLAGSFAPAPAHGRASAVPMIPTTPAVPPAAMDLPASHPLADKRRKGVFGMFRKRAE